MTLSSNIGNHAILSSDIYLGVSSMNQMINQNQFLTENSYTKLKNDHDLKVPFTGYAYSNSSIITLLFSFLDRILNGDVKSQKIQKVRALF